jgi:hypothetical protein
MVRSRRFGLAAAMAAVAVAVLSGCAPPPTGGPVPVLIEVNPNLVDPGLPSDPSAPNFSAAPLSTVAARNRLVVLFNGTDSIPRTMGAVARALASDGYHVIGLRYDVALGMMNACPPNSTPPTDPQCHRWLRSEVLWGSGVAPGDGSAGFDHPMVNVTATTSVMNRLLAYVDYLASVRQAEGWSQFQQRSGGVCAATHPIYGDCDLNWGSMVAIGHGQGAGMALYLGKFHALDRVGMLSGSHDSFGIVGSYQPAAWLSEPTATPTSRLAHFLHGEDPNLLRQRAVATAIGSTDPEVDTGQVARPYANSRRLLTIVQPTCLTNPDWAYGATIEGICSPKDVHVNVWRYLAGGS